MLLHEAVGFQPDVQYIDLIGLEHVLFQQLSILSLEMVNSLALPIYECPQPTELLLSLLLLHRQHFNHPVAL